MPDDLPLDHVGNSGGQRNSFPRATFNLWTQIVGKIRLVQTPWVNHSWHVALYLTSRGLTTSPIPYGTRTFQIDFDFLDHRLLLQTSDGAVAYEAAAELGGWNRRELERGDRASN